MPATSSSRSDDSESESSDPVDRLRSALLKMPGARKFVFTPATRAEILSGLYTTFWGPYAHLFLPNSNSSLPLHTMLSEVQTPLKFGGAGREDPPIPGRPCTRIFRKGDSCFRCKDCALDDSCVMCSSCFHSTNHVDHSVSFFIAQQPGGCCDCGDEEAWKIPLNCPFHPPAGPEADGTPRFSTKPLPQEIQPVLNYPFRVSVPPELHDSMRRTVACALDFILDTLDYSPDESSFLTTETELLEQPSADPLSKDHFCIIIWNDEKHSFDEVIKLLCDTTSRTKEEASALAHRIDENGREVVDMQTSITRVIETAQSIKQIDLGVTIRRAYDTFREQIVEVIIEWLLDLTRSRLATDVLIMREVIAAELLSPRRRDSRAPPNDRAILSLPEVPTPTRLDTLFLYHPRLWKKPRLSVKEIYASTVTLSPEHKFCIAGHFANVYHSIIDGYILVDREPETSIKYFALQIFTVPSVALRIVRHHKIISRLLAVIASFFTNQIVDRHIVYPPDPKALLDVDSFPFKSKRFMPVFSDLRYLCQTDSVQDLIAHNRDFLVEFAKTCQLFMCLNPNKRAVTSHVEYEQEAWISVFNVTLSLSRVIKVYGGAFARASMAELVTAIATVIHHILIVCTLTEERLDPNKFAPPEFHQVQFGGVTYEIVQFDVLEGWVSFHHSLHWLLAELFKHVELLSEKHLAEAGFSSVRDVIIRHANEGAILSVIDFPVRVLAMIAQIRTGLWVRNGFAIRGQVIHYRDHMLRELCYDQDIFMIQVGLITSDPRTIIITILDRFGLLPYFSGDTLRSAYEGSQLSNMVEEVLYVIITILSENGNSSRMPIDVAIRREITHALAMGPCTYTDLTKRVAERLVEDASFERELKKIANFKPPESPSDTGMYELKDEGYDNVNPFFYHYTRNKREEVEAILKARLKKKTGVADPFIVPKPFGVTHGPFAIIPATFETEVLLQIIFYALYNTLVYTDPAGSAQSSAEAILDQAVHLVMLALVERLTVFSHLSAITVFEEEKTLIDVICTLEHHEKYKSYQSRVEWILSRLEEVVPEEVRSRRRVLDVSNVVVPDPLDAKKRAAKARQDAIMQRMKEQQDSFLTNFDDGEDYEEEDMEVETEEHFTYGTCIVCQEDLNSTRPFGALGLVQPSRFIRRHPDSQNMYLNEVLETTPSLDRAVRFASPLTFPPSKEEVLAAKVSTSGNFDGFPAAYTRFGLHSSVCSHMMHLDCFHQYTMSIRSRHRAQGTRNHPENISRKEYICPLCKSLGNVMLPVTRPSSMKLTETAFPDWIRTAGINILKSKPDPLLESLQFRNGTGEFVFWAAQDPGYSSVIRSNDRTEGQDTAKMLETVMLVSKSFSQQTRHLRDRPEPDTGERGAGIYLPEELLGYTIAVMEISQRGNESSGGLMVDNLSESHMQMIRGHLKCLARLAALHFKSRLDEGRDAVRQAIVKRLLPEWSRTSLTSFSYPLLLRDPFTILVETAAVAPEILNHVLVLTYYACLARTVVGLVYVLNKTRSYNTVQIPARKHEGVFGDIRMFFMSVVRHSPVFEHTATLAFETFGEARIEQLLYAFTLPFLRRASILCRAVLPSSFPTPFSNPGDPEYNRLLKMLGIPPLSSLPHHDTLQNALSGWCAHYGHSHAASQLNCGVMLDYPSVYRLARLPLVLDNLFGQRDKALTCPRCNTLPADAAICLFCGVACCMQSNCCMDLELSSRGECNMHTRECGGAVGMYFLVKRCSLLYLFANNGTFAQSPYLDAHGEIDLSMRRGRRQYLHHARWEDARKAWLNHQIPTIVARKLESTLDSGGWETL